MPKAGDACALDIWLRLEQESPCAENSAELLTSEHTRTKGAQVPGAQLWGTGMLARDSWLRWGLRATCWARETTANIKKSSRSVDFVGTFKFYIRYPLQQ